MNKKLSTLLAGTLLALSTSAFAQTDATKLMAVGVGATPATPNSFVSGNTYYVVVDANGDNLPSATELLLGQSKTTAAPITLNPNNATATTPTTEQEFQWVVTEEVTAGNYFYRLKNVATGAYLTIDETGTMVADPAKAKDAKNSTAGTETSTYFVFTGNAAYSGTSAILNSTNSIAKTISKEQLTIAAGTTPASIQGGASGTKIILCQLKAVSGISSKDLNKIQGNGFALGFPSADPAPATNLFGEKMKAVTVPAAGSSITIDGTAVTTGFLDGTTISAGLYFVTSEAENATIVDDDGNAYFVSQQKFNDCKFLAVDPVANYEVSAFTKSNSEGYKFKTISGADLKSTPAKGETAYENAIFSVTEVNPTNNKGAYQITVTPKVAKDADTAPAGSTSVYVSAYTTMGMTVVTTCNKTQANATNIMKASTTKAVGAADLLKKDAPALFNIQFTSGKDDLKKATSSEYGKYLGLTSNGTSYSYLAQGPAYLDLDAPQNQWIVTGYNNGIFTFTNREDTGEEIKLELRKTDIENVYDVYAPAPTSFKYAYVDQTTGYTTSASSKDLNDGGFQVKLVSATLTEDAAYADLTKEELAQPVKIKFTIANKLYTKNMYVSADKDNKKVSLTEDADYATNWDIVKLANKSDSISAKVSYAYMKDAKTVATKEITDRALTTYLLKMNGESKAWYLQNWTAAAGAVNQVKEDNATRFVIKVNHDGSLYLIEKGSNTAYATTINAATDGMSVSSNAALDDENIYKAVETGVKMEFETAVLYSESLEAQPRHASFQSINGGFLGMDENNDAIIAATKDEAQALTFWLDTTDVKELSTSFYISQAVASEPEAETKAAAVEPRMFLFNAVDSVSYYDEGTASTTKDYNYLLNDGATVKAIFKAATLVNKDSINTIVKGKEVGLNKDDLKPFKFNIVLADDEDEIYAIQSVKDGHYLTNKNGKIGFTNDPYSALIVALGAGDATANEAIAAESGVQVIGGEGVVTVQGAAGKVVTVANILGQTIANQVATSDNVTIAVPAGIVVVAVDGEATKVVVK